MLDKYKNHDVAVYGGYLSDSAKLMQCSSGGIATALAEYMLDQGGYVVGVAYSKDYYSAEYIIVSNKSDLECLKGSKYIDADKNNIYTKVENLINAGEKVLFFGFPCVVAAMYKRFNSRPQNLITCELVCHGPVNIEIHREYLQHLENKYKSKITEFSARHKKVTGHPAYLYAKFENGAVFEKPFYETEYGYALSYSGRNGCYQCRFKSNNRQGDIMIGDFWGATDKDVFWNKYGISSIFAETEMGNTFLLQTPGIKIFPVTFELATKNNPMVFRSKQKNEKHLQLEKLLSEKGLILGVKHATTIKDKIKKWKRKIYSILKNAN